MSYINYFLNYLLFLLFNQPQIIFFPLFSGVLAVILYNKLKKPKILIQTWHFDRRITETKKPLIADKVKLTKDKLGHFKSSDVMTFEKKRLKGLRKPKLVQGLVFVEGAVRPISFSSKALDLGIPLLDTDIQDFVERQELKSKQRFKPVSRGEFIAIMLAIIFVGFLVFMIAMRIGVF